ncbi:hypothetical protein [Ruegeria faecimaris]|uniref:hypothetical protein n=1 Tax=Ruegeria faecimaris TaxID=686389 RepID=UPI0024901500|nr:hypothetical protein [Ruegeria faecimaris]
MWFIGKPSVRLITTNGSTNITSDVVVRDNIGNFPKHQIQVEDVTAEFSWWKNLVHSSRRYAWAAENQNFSVPYVTTWSRNYNARGPTAVPKAPIPIKKMVSNWHLLCVSANP